MAFFPLRNFTHRAEFSCVHIKKSAESPCIMCVQYIGGCSVHRGVFSTSGGCLVHRGDTMSTSGATMSTSGGYHEYIGGVFSTSEGYHEYIGGCSVHRGIS